MVTTSTSPRQLPSVLSKFPIQLALRVINCPPNCRPLGTASHRVSTCINSTSKHYRSVSQSVRRSVNQSISQSVNRSASQAASQPASQPASQVVSPLCDVTPTMLHPVHRIISPRIPFRPQFCPPPLLPTPPNLSSNFLLCYSRAHHSCHLWICRYPDIGVVFIQLVSGSMYNPLVSRMSTTGCPCPAFSV
jgi:hypothetical protein